MIRDQIPEKLLADVKLDLGITWHDEVTDQKVRNDIAAGIDYLNRRRGGPGGMDIYEDDTVSRALLFEYVRYKRDSALEVFENNYQSMILDMQNERKVRDHVEETAPE